MDLRGCVYTGKNLADKVLSGALVSDADFSKTVMSNVTMTKSYAKGANFSGTQSATVTSPHALSFVTLLCHQSMQVGQSCAVATHCPGPRLAVNGQLSLQQCLFLTALWLAGADLTNAVLDRVDFTDANLSGAKFTNAVITGAKFTGANLDGATFEDALIGQEDYKQM